MECFDIKTASIGWQTGRNIQDHFYSLSINFLYFTLYISPALKTERYMFDRLICIDRTHTGLGYAIEVNRIQVLDPELLNTRSGYGSLASKKYRNLTLKEPSVGNVFIYILNYSLTFIIPLDE